MSININQFIMKDQLTRKSISLALGLATVLALPLGVLGADEAAAETKSLTGEIVDLMCYLDHGAKGEKHKGCAEKCIKSGGPVGILSGEQVYLVVGDHKPANEELSAKAGQTVTLKGKVVERSGMKMIENAELEK
jgi:hypothetical protein